MQLDEVWGSAQYGRNIGSPGQNDEGVSPRVLKNERKPSVQSVIQSINLLSDGIEFTIKIVVL